MCPSNIDWTETGPLAPDTSEVLEAIEQDWQNAIPGLVTRGNDGSFLSETRQGQLISSETAIVQEKNNSLLYLASQFDPRTASGIFQDALGQLYSIDRKEKTHNVATCECVGLAGSYLPGLSDGGDIVATAQDITGKLWRLLSGATIPASGVIMLDFQAEEAGPVAAGANTINRIYQGNINGWDSVNNPQAGTVGSDTENAADFEDRRVASLALNASGSVDAIFASLYNLPDVLDCAVRENKADTPVTIQGMELLPHSIYCAVSGGRDADIAQVIYRKKSPGCNTTGSVSYTVNAPIPDSDKTVPYVMNFDRAVDVSVYIRLTIGADGMPSNIVDQVKTAIFRNFNGMDREKRVRQAERLYASRFVCPAQAAGAANVISIEVSRDGVAWASYLDFKLNERPTLDRNNITVNVAGA